MTDFWSHHGIVFVVCMFIFPRLTLLFSGVAWGGLLWWLGLVFAPRLLVAILATSVYWETNTVLCILTWIWALGGESTEKEGVRRRATRRKPAEMNTAG